MSDAGRKMDVEDVLSSIRRLVSEEARSEPEPHRSEASTPKPSVSIASEPTPPAHEKLVLTPAFRIPEDPPTGKTAEDCADDPVFPTPQEPELSETLTLPDTLASAITDDIAVSIDLEITSALAFEPAITAAEVPEMSPFDISENVPEFSQAEPENDVQAEHTSEPGEFSTNAEEPEQAPPAEKQNTAEMVEEAPVHTAPPTPTPEFSVVEEPQDKAQTAPEYAAGPEPVPAHPIHNDAYGAIDYTANQDNLLDEEALRELVSEMVRSELQGELGDRITRNVRKLVRREIHRALASRDFD